LKRTAVLLLLAGCATSRPRATPPVTPPPAEEGDTTFTVPDVASLEGWQGPSVEHGTPVALRGGGAAVLLTRRSGDRVEVALAVGGADGAVGAVVPVASVAAAGSKRETVVSLERFPLGHGDHVRADVRVFDSHPPRFFAVKTVLFAVDAGAARPVLDRISESGNDVRDRRAVLAARDVDGDGQPELVVEEKESGSASSARTLVYRRSPDGTFVTDGRSIFE
jgi:hypothetical protein